MLIGCFAVRSVKLRVTMPSQPELSHTHTTPQPKPYSKWRRIAWFVGFWAVSVAALAIVSQLIKWAIVP